MKGCKAACFAAAVIAFCAFAAPAFAQSNVLFVLDASGSMKKKLASGDTRFAIAQSSMSEVLKTIPPEVRVGLLLYGHRKAKDCTDIELTSPIGADDPATITNVIMGLSPKGETPIAESLRQAARSFAALGGQKNRIIIVTDGIEECGGDPCAAAQAIADAGLSLAVDVVGFTLTEEQRSSVECIPHITGGNYYDAQDAQSLAAAFTEVSEQIAAAPEPAPAEPEAPAAPAELPRKVVFSDEFDGGDLSADWEVVNANLDSYLVENGSITAVTSTPGGFANPDIANIFELKKDLPDSDYAITVKFSAEYATGVDNLSVGLYQDKDNYIEAAVAGNANCCYQSKIEVRVTKVSGGQVTEFLAPLFLFAPTNNEPFANGANAVAQPVTVKLIKEGHSFRASANFAGLKDEAGAPVWVTTDPITSLRAPKIPAINVSQRSSVTGETTFMIDSITIDVPDDGSQ